MKQDYPRNEHADAPEPRRHESAFRASSIKDTRSWPLVTIFQAKGAWT